MHRIIIPIVVLGASLALAVPALGKGRLGEPQWMQALEVRSQELNRQHGLGRHDPALRALELRSEALNRRYGVGDQAYPYSTMAVNEAIREVRSGKPTGVSGLGEQAYPYSTTAVNEAIAARERAEAVGRGEHTSALDARERSFAAKREAQLANSIPPDVFERAVLARERARGTDHFIAADDRFRIDAANTPPQVSTVSSSGVEVEWPQIGVGFGIGILLMLGLMLAVRATRHPPLAH